MLLLSFNIIVTINYSFLTIAEVYFLFIMLERINLNFVVRLLSLLTYSKDGPKISLSSVFVFSV